MRPYKPNSLLTDIAEFHGTWQFCMWPVKVDSVRMYKKSSMGHYYHVFVPEIFQAQTAHGDCAARIRDITGQVADLVGFRTKDGEIVMSGWGYSKSFQIGYSLGLALWPNGTTEPHGMRNGEPDTCGGYAISVY